ncbi:hypothetical protein BX666DRAFT_2073950 [Dichotomocladium elegans]|nr:hypothetical protein BX666DRAFT_2073950 [Dichotomocladium elegans]
MTSLYDVYPTFLTELAQQDPPIYWITMDQYVAMRDKYRSTPLPSSSTMFPWLHGVDGQSNQQNLYFGVRRCLAPRHRDVMLIHDGSTSTTWLRDAVGADQILHPSEDMFLATSSSNSSIQLRNFHLQVPRYATLCDLVVYGTHDTLVLANRLARAQAVLRSARIAAIEKTIKSAGKRAAKDANDLQYNVFIIKGTLKMEPPEVIQMAHPELRSPGKEMSFEERERQAIRSMSKASEITPHVWAGNTQDVPVSEDDDDDASVVELLNPHRFSICIEAHDLADMPLPSTLTLATETLKEVPMDALPQEIIHFDVYSTFVAQSSEAFEDFYSKLYFLLQFIDLQTSAGRNVLIHCADGYSESSMIVLAWIMYKHHLRLPEAYLFLEAKRSFFVYAPDIPTLLWIESNLQADNDDDDDDEMAMSIEDDRRMGSGSIGEGSASGAARDHRQLYDDAFLNDRQLTSRHAQGSNDMWMTQMIDGQMVPPVSEAIRTQFGWFYSPRFEGTFPSRILPFMFLGNLNHATNPAMLEALGITHVVSVGEHADVDATRFKLLFLDRLYDDGINSIHPRLEETMLFIGKWLCLPLRGMRMRRGALT